MPHASSLSALIASATLLTLTDGCFATQIGLKCELTLPRQKQETYHISIDPDVGQYTMRTGQSFERVVRHGDFSFGYQFGANFQAKAVSMKLFFPMTPPYMMLIIDERDFVTATTLREDQPFPVGPCRVDTFKGL
jgi:hypothetical protein